MLKPSFHPKHLWTVVGDQTHVEVVGTCKSFSAVWRPTQEQIVEVNRTVFTLAYEQPSKMRPDFDGIDVEYEIETTTEARLQKYGAPPNHSAATIGYLRGGAGTGSMEKTQIMMDTLHNFVRIFLIGRHAYHNRGNRLKSLAGFQFPGFRLALLSTAWLE